MTPEALNDFEVPTKERWKSISTVLSGVIRGIVSYGSEGSD